MRVLDSTQALNGNESLSIDPNQGEETGVHSVVPNPAVWQACLENNCAGAATAFAAAQLSPFEAVLGSDPIEKDPFWIGVIDDRELSIDVEL